MVGATGSNQTAKASSTNNFNYNASTSSLGIGTATPQANLHVVGTATTVFLVSGTARVTGTLAIGTSSITLDGNANTISGVTTITDSSGGYLSHPPGTLIFHCGSSAPAGYIKANGATVSRSAYSALFSGIGTIYGAGDGSTTFQIPDMRGYFPRGFDDGAGVDSGRTFGTSQADAFASHLHTWNFYQGSWNSGTSGNVCLSTNQGTTDRNTGSTGGTETRPKNIALLACIKY